MIEKELLKQCNKFRIILLKHFIKHIPLISEDLNMCTTPKSILKLILILVQSKYLLSVFVTNKMIFSKGLVIIINIVCFCFVAWKSIECFVKYSKDPKGTNVGVEYAGHQKMFPTITICGPPPKTDNKSTRWNQTYLHQCGINGYVHKK